jgi:hypothetical protein
MSNMKPYRPTAKLKKSQTRYEPVDYSNRELLRFYAAIRTFNGFSSALRKTDSAIQK